MTDNPGRRDDPISGPLRTAILGAGGISPMHAAVLRDLPNARLVAVCDLSPERGNRLARAYAIPDAFCSMEAMLERSRPDVVHVLLPPSEHVRCAVQCLEAGAHVFVEKPMGVSLAECGELRRAAVARGRTVGVNHNMLYRPVVQRLIGEIRANRLGRLAHVTVGWSIPPEKIRHVASVRYAFEAPQNALLEWAVHPLSIIRRLLGRLEEVCAVAGRERSTESGQAYTSSWQASMRCERGTAQLVLAVGEGYDCGWVDVLGEDALAHVDIRQDAMILSEHRPGRPSIAGLRHALSNAGRLVASAGRNYRDDVLAMFGSRSHGTPAELAMRDSIHAFYAALERGQCPPEGLDQGAATVEYCERLWQSAHSNGRGAEA
jgi:predicted dehydrogenase